MEAHTVCNFSFQRNLTPSEGTSVYMIHRENADRRPKHITSKVGGREGKRERRKEDNKT